MTQAEKDKIIKELQEKLAEAEKIEVDNKRWKPKDGEEYWIIEDGGGCGRYHYSNVDNFDEWCYLTGNCFKTKEEAEEYRKQIEYTAQYKNYIEEHDEPIDWNNKDTKYIACFDSGKNEIDISEYYISKVQGAIYASSEQIIWDAIKEIGEDNFKKYVLGVK